MHQIWGFLLAGESGETGNVIFLLGLSDTSVSIRHNSLLPPLTEKNNTRCLWLPSDQGYGSTPTFPEQIVFLPFEDTRGGR